MNRKPTKNLATMAAEHAHLEEAARLLRLLADVVYTRHMGGESNVVAVAKWLEAERVRVGKKEG